MSWLQEPNELSIDDLDYYVRYFGLNEATKELQIQIEITMEQYNTIKAYCSIDVPDSIICRIDGQKVLTVVPAGRIAKMEKIVKNKYGIIAYFVVPYILYEKDHA